ncbi:73b8ede6-96bf-4ca0-bcf0-be8fd18a24d2 [Sclerotinia trifoliorum]|uniref:73b8ede6-96bf-4ca0-bcf0-be8fd18a24d2 n=1 Tax=Sclerotinia trifoliorum TaxID=28548 RepID=A0A8H2ZQV8_9HELO|nr:73b8ede6-96bf-4ca0-bcf0-be8fd18a24d2 [Sclerotinia trifoliorum]
MAGEIDGVFPEICCKDGVAFLGVMGVSHDFKVVTDVWNGFETRNLEIANAMLADKFQFSRNQGWPGTMLVMDGDRTLVTDATGALFWQKWIARNRSEAPKYQLLLKLLFRTNLGYSCAAFRQVALVYGELMDETEYNDICQEVASVVNIHQEFVSLLQSLAEEKHIGAVIISCGLHRVWEKVLEKEGLSKSVKVIAGGPDLVDRLRLSNRTYVCAFGDSPLDLGMLKAANKAIVVVGEVDKRSKKMEAELLNAIDNDGLHASQLIIPHNALPIPDTQKLPLIKLTDQKFLELIFSRHSRHAKLKVIHATDENSMKLLMIPTCDATNKSPALGEYHRSIYRYLVIELIFAVIGLESYEVPHVQALMPGGEPMALGINGAFLLAMSLHAKDPQDIMPEHLQGKITVVLVDTVINNGKMILEFVQHICNLNAIVRIVVAAGVVHQSIAEGTGIVAHTLVQHGNCSIAALRISDNKFMGKEVTDTDDRFAHYQAIDLTEPSNQRCHAWSSTMLSWAEPGIVY